MYLNLFNTSYGLQVVGYSDSFVDDSNYVPIADVPFPSELVGFATDWVDAVDKSLAQFFILNPSGYASTLLNVTEWLPFSPDSTILSVTMVVDGGTQVLGSLETTVPFLQATYGAEEIAPATFWAISDGTIYDGLTYNAGDPLVIYTFPQPTTPPTGFTDVQPIGSVSAYDTWQWNGTAWIAAPFPITLDLAGAQDYLTKLVQANASILINNQLSSYDGAQIAAAADPELLEPRYKALNLYPTIGDYRTAVDAETAPLLADIASATAVNQLYVFDPTVNEPPNYTP